MTQPSPEALRAAEAIIQARDRRPTTKEIHAAAALIDAEFAALRGQIDGQIRSFNSVCDARDSLATKLLAIESSHERLRLACEMVRGRGFPYDLRDIPAGILAALAAVPR